MTYHPFSIIGLERKSRWLVTCDHAANTVPPDLGGTLGLPEADMARHIAYDVDNIDAAIQAARDHSVEPIGPVVAIDQGPNRGSRVAYLRDPDGITIEFIEKA